MAAAQANLSFSSPLCKPTFRLQPYSLLYRPRISNASVLSLLTPPTALTVRNPSTHLPFSSRRKELSSRKLFCGSLDKALQVVTESSWKESVMESEVAVLVEFWAPWCGPCRMIEPQIDEIARQYAGKLKCFKLNTDDSPQVATDYGVRSIPTVLLFKNGEKKETVIGAVPKSALVSLIDKHT